MGEEQPATTPSAPEPPSPEPSPPPDPSVGHRLRLTALTGAAALLLAVGTVTLLDATGHLQGGLVADRSPTPTPTGRTARPVPSTSPAAAVLAPADAATTTVPTARLRQLLRSRSLGPGPGAVVLGGNGDVLLDQGASTARTPASVVKLATCATALLTVGPDARLTTRVVAGAAADEIVLVGGGDTTLTRRPARAGYPRPASLAQLADLTAAALHDRTAPAAIHLQVDDSLFSGPAVPPSWPAGYVGSGVVSPVSALSVDGGRVRPGADARSPDPALAAGRVLARLLDARGVTVADVIRATAPAGAEQLAEVRSPTVAELVETTLATSDNDLAESLLRLSAIARQRPGTFADGIAMVGDELGRLGVPVPGLVLQDGSGLSRADAVAPITFARLLQTAAGTGHPALGTLLSGLPVAGYTGTLEDRFTGPVTRRGAGFVRAKTGTLTGVSSLAGVTERDGGTVVLVVLADRVPVGDTLAARSVLDRFATALAR